jgi:hypothetical protein
MVVYYISRVGYAAPREVMRPRDEIINGCDETK